MDKKYDIVLLGASGFTGKITTHFLDTMCHEFDLTWAIAGRNMSKLQALAQKCKKQTPDIFVTDVSDGNSLDKMTSSVKIVMNAVGPFSTYGKNVVSSCIKFSTHYLDITGEPHYVSTIFNNFHQKAKDNKSCIVNCCGFDSIPAEFCVYETIKRLSPSEPKIVRGFVRTNASFSGGTLTTAIEALERESQNKSEKINLKYRKSTYKEPLKIHYQKDLNAWAIPMPVVDPHIVRRSAYYMRGIYGEDILYRQYFLKTTFTKMLKTILSVGVLFLSVKIGFLKSYFLNKFSSGSGPSAEKRFQSKFEFTCIGQTATQTVKTTMSGKDPGYDETAKMFSLAALCIFQKLSDNSIQYGVLTPVQALGDTYVPLLIKNNIQITFS